MKIVLATANRHKVEEIRSYLSDLPIEFFPINDFPEIHLKEEGMTLRENVLQKARIAAGETGLWALADDTGLFVDSLDGRPGVFSARLAGEEANAEANIEKLLQEMKNIPQEKRTAFFSCLLALVHPDGREVVVEGRLQGVIVTASKGVKGFGYDPVFFIPDRQCTLAEISLEEKNKISHRASALFKMRGVLAQIFRGVAQPG